MLLQIYLLPNEDDFSFSDQLLRNSHLENERFVTEKGVTSAGYNGGSFKRAWNPAYDNRTIETYLWIEKPMYPSNCRNIVFKADVSIGNSWPLPIEVEFRKNGKDIQRPKPKMPDNSATS